MINFSLVFSSKNVAFCILAFQAMQSLLNKFGVLNRENMFVYKEATGAVFYLRLHEKSQSASAALNSMEDSKLEMLREAELNGEVSRFFKTNLSRNQVFLFQGNFMKRLDAPSGSTPSAVRKKFSLSKWMTRQCQDKILLTVHGVQAPSGEIVGQLVPALQHRLDDAVLDVLSVTLERNPSCKLTREDVEVSHF